MSENNKIMLFQPSQTINSGYDEMSALKFER